MPIAFDRGVCCDLNETISREWLVTNGLGSYAAGTIAGALTRMEHGLLVTTPRNASTPHLLLAKIDEEILFDQRTYYLGTNEYRDGTINPSGFVHLETFRLEEGFPIFTYRLGGIDGITLEKRIWMPQGQNTTCIQYRVQRTAQSGDPVEHSQYNSHPERNSVYNPYARYHPYTEASQRALELTLLPLAAYRSHQEVQYGNNDWHFAVDVHHTGQAVQAATQFEEAIMLPNGVAGCTIRAWEGAQPYHLFAVGHAASRATFIPTGVWYWHFLRRHDRAAGQAIVDDLYLPGVFRARLGPGEDSTLTIVVTTEEISERTFNIGQYNLSYRRSVERERALLQPQRYFGEGGETTTPLHVLPMTGVSDAYAAGEEFLRLLLQAGDHFLARRRARNERERRQKPFFTEPDGAPFMLADYYDLAEHTRDTLIALPGLTLATGRFEEARRLLRDLARHFRQGMLPDHPPTAEHPLTEADYGSVDTTLWYFYALGQYARATHDYELVEDLYYRLEECIRWYTEGTYYAIQVDPADGLLRAQDSGRALTWMNASVHGSPVTSRQGKPVEVNALWYHALRLMDEWTQLLRRQGRPIHSTTRFQEQSIRCKESFQRRFWYEDGGYLYDVVDGPSGNDASLRPNQLLALSLQPLVLHAERQQAVLDRVVQHLRTPYGLRTLAPGDQAYHGHPGESPEAQQQALHQGNAWSWLIGPYIDALLNLHGANPSYPQTAQAQARQERGWRICIQALEPFRELLTTHMLGMVGGSFAGDEPHAPARQVASAMGVGELLRVHNLLAQIAIRHKVPALLA